MFFNIKKIIEAEKDQNNTCKNVFLFNSDLENQDWRKSDPESQHSNVLKEDEVFIF